MQQQQQHSLPAPPGMAPQSQHFQQQEPFAPPPYAHHAGTRLFLRGGLPSYTHTPHQPISSIPHKNNTTTAAAIFDTPPMAALNASLPGGGYQYYSATALPPTAALGGVEGGAAWGPQQHQPQPQQGQRQGLQSPQLVGMLPPPATMRYAALDGVGVMGGPEVREREDCLCCVHALLSFRIVHVYTRMTPYTPHPTPANPTTPGRLLLSPPRLRRRRGRRPRQPRHRRRRL
jgi:hypothetical protein